ncbi:type II secretion system minor pseudopilin GspJ [Psychrobium sp. MM17-31]|uniref:type II secretion system minor pseudopilin GspJ n=1 Tax=Psychrobium sp. MM17-31 TaxID=2917758 RepID=UPI001EF49F10|nr:type II secretion system minor pseudopilin GspJ [Psychrobium sp. MM17-31]MCG7532201.1 type II secretion system minor pseudopilin GspJ [Psychrobium sp. MM17-31]
MKKNGFTLIEVLIAMAIVAIIGVASAQVVSSVIDSDQASQKADKRITLLQRTYQTIQRDMLQMATRSVRVNGGKPQKRYIFAGENVLESDEDGIVFTRKGWRNPAQMFPRSNLQGVGYRVRDGKLERLHFLYPDQAAGVEPEVTTLIEGVTGFKIEYFDAKKWQKEWQKPTLPKGIALDITTEAFGDIRWQFLVPGGPVAQTAQGGNP